MKSVCYVDFLGNFWKKIVNFQNLEERCFEMVFFKKLFIFLTSCFTNGTALIILKYPKSMFSKYSI